MSGAAPLVGDRLLRPSAAAKARPLEEALRAAGPPLLFGLRLWASVSLALYAAFWLQLDSHPSTLIANAWLQLAKCEVGRKRLLRPLVVETPALQT